tara:strand:+ start:719 stop:871 length:153 start_codon:yes stop_codon:yes gene_type:complete
VEPADTALDAVDPEEPAEDQEVDLGEEEHRHQVDPGEEEHRHQITQEDLE